MGRADQHHRAAIEVAQFLDSIGEHKRANDVRAIYRSLASARSTLSTIHSDNLRLCAELDRERQIGHQGIGARES